MIKLLRSSLYSFRLYILFIPYIQHTQYRYIHNNQLDIIQEGNFLHGILGINLTGNLQDLYKDNFESLLRAIKGDLKVERPIFILGNLLHKDVNSPRVYKFNILLNF